MSTSQNKKYPKWPVNVEHCETSSTMMIMNNLQTLILILTTNQALEVNSLLHAAWNFVPKWGVNVINTSTPLCYTIQFWFITLCTEEARRHQNVIPCCSQLNYFRLLAVTYSYSVCCPRCLCIAAILQLIVLQ